VTVDPQGKRVEISWDDEGQSTAAPVSHAPAAPAAHAAHAAPAPTQTAAPAASAPDRNKEWTAEEIAKHNKESDCWVVVNNQVLDVTKFLPDHPGGKKPILIFAGRDASAEFNMLHKPDVVEKYAPDSIIGVTKGGH